MNLVNSVPVPSSAQNAPVSTPLEVEKPVEALPVNMEAPKDTVEISHSQAETQKNVEPPKISRMRLMFSRLTDEQIKAVNESRMLPKNAKFQLGGKVICNNWFGICDGTQKLLPGYELKKNVFGFTVVVPEGTKGLFIRKSPEEKLAAQAAK